MPTLVMALGLATALAGLPAGGQPDGLLVRVQAAAPASPGTATVPPSGAPLVPAEATMPFSQGALPGQTAPGAAPGQPGQPLSDPAIEARINAQIQTLLMPPSGGFTVQRYARPDTASPAVGSGGASTGLGGAPLPPGGTIVRAGTGYGGTGYGGAGYGGVPGPGGAPSGAAPLQQQAGYPVGGPFGNQGGQPSGGFGQPGQGQGSYPSQANGQGQGGYGQGGLPPQGGYGQGAGGQGGYGQAGYGQGGYPGGGPGPNGGYGPPPVKRYAIARAGDTVFATLDQGYNSDDPQAPIFATIYDVDSAQQPGPLNGVRLIGQIVYSTNQAAIQFTQMVLLDGRQFPLKAYAISARDARTGVSNDVDEHVFERYAGLFAATLIQGAGQAGQLLLQTNRNVLIDPATGFAVSQSGSGVRTQAALAALLPLGQAATAVAAQNFNRPATIAGQPGYGIGVVFLEPPALPRDALYRGGVYRDVNVVSRLN